MSLSQHEKMLNSLDNGYVQRYIEEYYSKGRGKTFSLTEAFKKVDNTGGHVSHKDVIKDGIRLRREDERASRQPVSYRQVFRKDKSGKWTTVKRWFDIKGRFAKRT
jgi:hypothetical protein